jgi:hypothetical protein
MKLRAIFTAVLMLLAVGQMDAQAPTLGPNDAISFDYMDADVATYQVTSFQAQWDGGAWVALTSTAFKDAGTTVGATSHKFLTPFTNGTHTVSVRACNSVGCGGGSSPFAFAVLVVSPTAAPSNLRKVAK